VTPPGCVRLEAYEAGGLKRPEDKKPQEAPRGLKEEKRPRRLEEASRPALRPEA